MCEEKLREFDANLDGTGAILGKSSSLDNFLNNPTRKQIAPLKQTLKLRERRAPFSPVLRDEIVTRTAQKHLLIEARQIYGKIFQFWPQLQKRKRSSFRAKEGLMRREKVFYGQKSPHTTLNSYKIDG